MRIDLFIGYMTADFNFGDATCLAQI